MKTRTTTHILLVVSGLALATAPGHTQTDGPLQIIWQAAYGIGRVAGAAYAQPYDFAQTADGGFVIAGMVAGGTNEMRTAPICRGSDYYVIKIDAQGQRQWDRSYGGDSFPLEEGGGPGDSCYSAAFRADGGYVLVGISTSTTGCLKTAPLLGMPEMWAVRCDASGNALWDRSYLPTLMDFFWAFNLEPTRDGGYLACGSGAPNDRSAMYYGIVKFDDQGQQLWKIGRASCRERV